MRHRSAQQQCRRAGPCQASSLQNTGHSILARQESIREHKGQAEAQSKQSRQLAAGAGRRVLPVVLTARVAGRRH